MKTKSLIIVLGLIIAGVLLAVFVSPVTGIALAVVAPGLAQIKSSNDLKEERSLKLDGVEALINKAKEEKRDLLDEEKSKIDTFNAEIDALNIEIRRMETIEKNLESRAKKHISSQEKENREIQNYSFLKAVRSSMNGKLEGLEAEMHQEAVREARESGITVEGVGIPLVVLNNMVRRERRDQTVSGGSSGSEGGVLVETALAPGFIDVLRAKMVIGQLGATFIDGLVGNVDIARKTSGSSAAWEGETDAGAEGTPVWDKITLSPNRLGAYIQLSKRLLAQTSGAAEKMAVNDLEMAIRIALETAAINGSTPTGILQTSGIGSVAINATGGSPTWTHITNLEKEVAIDNADVGTLAYLTNPKVRAKLKQTETASSNGIFIWGQDNKLNGYNVGISTLVPSDLDKGATTGVCSAIIFGNFQDLLIAQWGGLDVIVDPYTDAKNALVNVIVNSWWDIEVRHAESFAAIKDALTT